MRYNTNLPREEGIYFRRMLIVLESWPETDRIMARGYTPGNQG